MAFRFHYFFQNSAPIVKPPGIEFVTLEEAAAAYRKGCMVAMETEDSRFLVMDSQSTFQTDFDFMMKARWIILGEVKPMGEKEMTEKELIEIEEMALSYGDPIRGKILALIAQVRRMQRQAKEAKSDE